MITIQQVKRTILIVKESQVKREVYRRYLQQETSFNYDFWEAESGEVALQLCGSQVPDCIVLDYLLPARNGLEVLVELKILTGENCPPVIMLNEGGNEAIAIQAFKMGVQDYLIESEITPESFRSVTRTAIENFHLRQQLRESEERYRAIVEDQTELICRFLSDCTLTFVNGAYSRYFDSTPEQLIGQNFLNLIPESHHHYVQQQIAELSVATPENAVITHEHPVIKLNGEIGWQQWTNRAIFNSDGELIEFQAVGRDITERKQREIALQKANERFEIAASVNCLIYDYDLEQNIVYRSPELTKIFGYSLQEAEPTAEWWYERIHPSQQEAIQEAKRSLLLGTETSICLEYQVYHRDGHYIWVQDRAFIARDESGKAERILGSTTDISDRKLAEQLLRESEERLRIGIQVARVGLARFDYASNAVELSSEAAVLYGFSSNESIVTRDRLHATFHPEERELMERIIEQVLDPNGDGWFEREHRVVWQNGEVKWLQVRKQVFFDRSGNTPRPDYAILAAIDITDRKLAEQLLRESKERLQIGVRVAEVGLARFDYASNTVELSPEAAVLYGFSRDDLIVTRDRIHATFDPEERELMEQIIEQVLDPNGDGWFEREHRVVWQNGEVRWLYVRKQVFFDRSGDTLRPDYAILAAIDITERKLAEAERERLLAEAEAAKEAAEAANRDKDEFVAVVAHELRSPINSVAGWMQLLRTRQFDPATINCAYDAIERGTQTQVQLIEDLLDISRIACGTLRLTFVPVNLMLVMQTALSLVRPMADAKQIHLETRLTQLAQVSGDLTRLQQIMVNLLTNAIKFTPEGGQVTIMLELVERQARITVRDTGQGISPEFLPNIFEQFQQAQKSLGSKGGLGLGLAIVKKLVELHNGTITAEIPGNGQGATFTVWLPLLESEPVIIPEEAAIALDTSPLAGIRILAVDDEPDSLELIRFILESAGAEVQTASSGSAALEILTQFNPDFLVSDIAMPDLNGHQLLQQIKSIYPERQILAIALTAYASSSDRDYALRIGFEKYFSKPIEPEILVQAIASLI
jgi:PAS domain S-box-containing protein